MIYDLMHKDTAVLRMRLNDESGLIESVEDVLSLRHLPVGTFQNGFLNGTDLKSWWAKRSIPASRSGKGRPVQIGHAVHHGSALQMLRPQPFRPLLD